MAAAPPGIPPAGGTPTGRRRAATEPSGDPRTGRRRAGSLRAIGTIAANELRRTARERVALSSSSCCRW